VQARVETVMAGVRPLGLGLAARVAGLLALAAIVPSLGLPQQVTGPVVNALLFLSVGWVGASNAMLVGGVPSMIGIAQGTLPLPLVAMVPYIVAGNAVLVGAFALLRRWGYAPAAVVAAVLKLALLYCAVTYVVRLPQPVATMMQLPQLYTALAGAIIAYGVERGGGRALGLLRGWMSQ
jgi:hypothetical protein